jgi:hypothetical protein
MALLTVPHNPVGSDKSNAHTEKASAQFRVHCPIIFSHSVAQMECVAGMKPVFALTFAPGISHLQQLLFWFPKYCRLNIARQRMHRACPCQRMVLRPDALRTWLCC